MRSRNAFARGLLSLGLVVFGTALFCAPANADEGAVPRAVPAARALPRSFSTYDALIGYAAGVAADQTALDQRLVDTTARHDAASAMLAALVDVRGGAHGGALFETDGSHQSRAVETSLRAQVLDLGRTEQQLLSAGALTTPAQTWRMPTAGEITQPFGPTDVWVEPGRTYDGVAYAHFHDGVDIAGPWAADVVAPARGRVVFVGQMMDGAEVVVLAHDDGVVTMYVHLDAWQNAPTVQAGDEVAAGQKIGTQGLTGITTGQHLHWAAYRNGRLIDPLSLLPS